jgi:hypothetical protein
MKDDYEKIKALIKELLILSRVEGRPPMGQSVKEIESRSYKRNRLRQELVRVLDLRNQEIKLRP